MLILAQVLKEKWFENHGFAHSQTTNKLVNKAVKNGANQIAGFGGFRPLASLEKN